MTVKKTGNKLPKKRLRPENREQQILDEAVSFFAEKGISGKTRDLADRLGITQPLLYRYFPTKRDLIEGVFEKVYLNKLNPEWLKTITDRERPL
ncbi:MAG: helix-turn-helix transcriptional regulator, partial [Gammaproteobacteria bacterium]|nr:helix-turn-helix transcriptional regulator [Gammaproteobacteria bacterium]